MTKRDELRLAFFNLSPLLICSIALLLPAILPQAYVKAAEGQDPEQGVIYCPADPITPCGPIYFSLQGRALNEEAVACLEEVALRLRQVPDSLLVIDGHRDLAESVKVSAGRAKRAGDYLVRQRGIDPARLVLRDYDSSCSHESGDVTTNGRVEFWMLPEGVSPERIRKYCAEGAEGNFRVVRRP
jgi:hypothetical protein